MYKKSNSTNLSYEQMSLKEYIDSFTGEIVKKEKRSPFRLNLLRHVVGKHFNVPVPLPVTLLYRTRASHLFYG